MKFAAFIITYERPGILPDTIKKIINQTFPPEKILIVDNSDSETTQKLIKKLNEPFLNYIRVGENSGPAGGAFIGLQQLVHEGYDWIYWVDDDDPPEPNNILEEIFKILHHVDKETCGQIGLVGASFNPWKGELVRLANENLTGEKIISVDSIGGNQCKIISSKVVNQGILPNKNLFYGFEELDFDLRIKKAGFKSYVSSNLVMESRRRNKRLNWKEPLWSSFRENNIDREYYNIRNLLHIYFSNYLFSAFFLFSIKKALSIFLAIYLKPKLGFKYLKVVFYGHYHFLKGKYGKEIMFSGQKYKT